MTIPSIRIIANICWIIAGFILMPRAAHAQAIWLPGSDPVNIARSGVGVAYGRSIEACSLNPALLATLRSPWTFYLADGLEMQSTQVTLPSNQRTLFTDDRNRTVPAFGAAWRATPKFALGFRADSPFMRHADLPEESSSRFFGKAIDLKTYRAEAQAALAVNDAFSLGISAGLTRMDYASAVSLRALVPMDPAKPYDIVSNPAEALMETVVRQAGSATAFTYGIGLRYAITSRWTVGGSYQSGVKGRPGFAATIPSRVINLFHPSGYKTPLPPLGTEDKAQVVMDAIEAHPGGGRLALPSRIQVGVRNRFNQLMTWEVDFRYIGISSTKIPAQPWISTRSGDVSTLNRDYVFRDGMAYSGMIEISLGKVWVSRCGFSLEPALRSGEEVDAMLGGSRSAGFSIGFGYQVFGGELSAGYQFRQAQDKESNGLEGSWSDSGLRHTGTLTRVEGMGHLLSIGFRKSF